MNPIKLSKAEQEVLAQNHRELEKLLNDATPSFRWTHGAIEDLDRGGYAGSVTHCHPLKGAIIECRAVIFGH